MIQILLLLPLIAPTSEPEFFGEVEQAKLIAESERGWETEVVMNDGSRADLVNDSFAAEVEWSSKWKEALAQAVLYSIWTGKKPLVILLVKDPRQVSEKLNILRCKLVCERLGIEMRTVEAKRNDEGAIR